MDAERWQRLSPLLDALIDLEPEARAARLAELRAEDPNQVAQPEQDDAGLHALTGPFGNSTQQERLSTGAIVEAPADRPMREGTDTYGTRDSSSKPS